MRLALAAGLAAALLAAGCGEREESTGLEFSWAPPPTGAGYSESLAELCSRTKAAHDAVGIATSPDELVRKLPRTLAIDRRFLAELQRLAPPPAVASRSDRLVRLFDGVLRNEVTALEFLRLKSWNGYFQYMDTALAIRLETDRIAVGLAAPACTFRPFRGA